MTRVFLFLTLRSLWNRATHRLRRLREPRYVAGLVVGLAYLYWFIVRQQLRSGRHPSSLFTDPDLAQFLPTILAVGALGLWAISALAWLWPSSEPPIRFSPAEVQFFYTAPVTRRQLLHYKILRSQLGVLFAVLITSLFSGALLAGHLAFLVGFWLLFSTLRLYFIGVGFTRASLSAAGRTAPWRAWVPLAVVGGISAVVLWAFARALPSLVSMAPGQAFRLVVETAQHGPVAAVLQPFQALIVPVFSQTSAELGRVAWPGLLLLAVNYAWAVQSELTLETAAATSERQQAAGMRRAPAPDARRSQFPLGPRGRAETAIAWKNLIQVGRYASPRMALRTILPLVILAFVASRSGKGMGLAPVVAIFAGFLMLIGPYMLRNDLRVDMTRLAVLKTWPVSGATVFLGEVLAPAALLTVLAWGAIAVTLGLSAGLAGLGPGERLSIAASAALIAPAIIAAQLVIQNAAVILFPGWIPTGPTRPRGIEAMGQQMLMFAGTLLLLAIGILPAGAVAAAVGFVLYQVAGIPGVVPAALLFAAALLAESALAILLLGKVLERTDPSAVEAEGS